jgi:hypothetical protein
MSFDLAIWVGDQPASDQEARKTFDRLMAEGEREISEGIRPEPDPRLAKCVREITGSYSDGLVGLIFGSVWTSTPVTPHGSIVYMNLRWGVKTKVLDFIAKTAAKHGLVCYDPQTSRVVDPANLAALHESIARSQAAFDDVVRSLRGK